MPPGHASATTTVPPLALTELLPGCLLWQSHSATHTHKPAHTTSALVSLHPRSLLQGSTMAERRGNWDNSEDDLPVYLARPGTADQVPRQKYGGLFCSVEGAFESKTIDFDALSVGQRGSRTPRTAKRETGHESRSPASDNRSSLKSPAPNRRGGFDSPQVAVRASGGKEVLQNLGDEKVNGIT